MSRKIGEKEECENEVWLLRGNSTCKWKFVIYGVGKLILSGVRVFSTLFFLRRLVTPPKSYYKYKNRNACEYCCSHRPWFIAVKENQNIALSEKISLLGYTKAYIKRFSYLLQTMLYIVHGTDIIIFMQVFILPLTLLISQISDDNNYFPHLKKNRFLPSLLHAS